MLSAVTAGIRSSWMSAIRRAANLPDPDGNVDSLTVCPDVQQEANPQSPTTYVSLRKFVHHTNKLELRCEFFLFK